jgi:transposase
VAPRSSFWHHADDTRHKERLRSMAQQPFFSIPLDIPDVRVLHTDITKAGEFSLTIESPLTSTTCHRCGRTMSESHGTDKPRLLRHLPILGRPVYLRIAPKRFRCPFGDDHPTTTQQLEAL